MKAIRFFMYGMIILGVLMLIGGAAALTMTILDENGEQVSQINPLETTLLNITFDKTNVSVTVIGCGVDNKTKTGEDSNWVAVNVTPNAAGVIDVEASFFNNETNEIETDSATIQVGKRTASRRTMVYSWTPKAPVANADVVITVLDKTRLDPVDDVQVDVSLNKKKVAYGITGDDGKFTFKPTTEGTYEVTLTKSNYRQEKFSINVVGQATTTTTLATTTSTSTTTTTSSTTTTTKATTTTKKTTTTTQAVTTTTQPTTTSTQPAAPAAGGMDWLWIIVVIIIIVAVVYFVVMKGKGAGKTEAPKETTETPKEGA